MIVLRIAIGWHLLYEGYTKIQSHYQDIKPFSAEMYLRNSTGPLRPYFRSLVDDFHGLKTLDPEYVESVWDKYVADQPALAKLSEEDKKKLDATLATLKQDLEDYISEKQEEIDRYKEEVAEWEKWEQERSTPVPGVDKGEDKSVILGEQNRFDWQYHKKRQRSLDKTRAELTGPIMKWSGDLESAAQSLVIDSKSASEGKEGDENAVLDSASVTADVPKIEWKPELNKVNLTTMWVLAISGGLLILGMFTRLASLAAACMLGLFYFSMPPWPGLDPSPIAEGTYLIVNKNLIELITLLMFATSPVGVWGGIDSLIRGLITRPIFGVGKREVISRDEF